MFLDKKTLLKIWLYPGLNLTIFRGTGPGVISFSVIKEIRNVKRNAKEQENKSRVLAKKIHKISTGKVKSRETRGRSCVAVLSLNC